MMPECVVRPMIEQYKTEEWKMDIEQRDGQLCQALLLMDVPPSPVIIYARIAQDDHGVIPGVLYTFAESFDAAEFSASVSCDVEHDWSPRFSWAFCSGICATGSIGNRLPLPYFSYCCTEKNSRNVCQS